MYHKLILLPNDLVDHCVDAELCKNGGICSNDGSERGYECLCLPGFYGDNCEIRKYNPKGNTGSPHIISGHTIYDIFIEITLQIY